MGSYKCSKQKTSTRVVVTALIILLLFLSCGTQRAFSKILFFEDFESNLNKWKSNTSGVITNDPVQGDKALSFTQLVCGGDIFSQYIYNPSQEYILSFDYLGTCSNGNCGGFIGFEPGLWLAGTTNYPGLKTILPDTGQWEHITIQFHGPESISLKIEDYYGCGGLAGDVYFDNILVTDANGVSSTPIPEPSSLSLLISTMGLLVFKRRSNKKR